MHKELGGRRECLGALTPAAMHALLDGVVVVVGVRDGGGCGVTGAWLEGRAGSGRRREGRSDGQRRGRGGG